MGAGIALILLGVFCLAGAALDWDWLFNSSSARIFVGLFGRQGARIFYILFGIGLVIFGIISFSDG